MSTSIHDSIEKTNADLCSYIEHMGQEESSSLAVVDKPECRKLPPWFEDYDFTDDDNRVVACLWDYLECRERKERSSSAVVDKPTPESRKRKAQDDEIEWLPAPTPPKKQKRVRFQMPASKTRPADAHVNQEKRTQWLEKAKKFSALYGQTDVFWQHWCQRNLKNVELEPEDGGSCESVTSDTS